MSLLQDTLFAGSYTSIWVHPFYAFLKELHENYDAVFTINLFSDCFANITDTFASELSVVTNWLKWTLHGLSTINYGSSGLTTGGEDWDNMVTAVITLTGNPSAIDRHTRLSNFAGTEDNIIAMRDRKFGAICFSAADDSRVSYDFDSNEAVYCTDNEYYYNSKTGLYFIPTYTRFDNKIMTQSLQSSILSFTENRRFSEFFIHEYSVVNSSGELVSTGSTFMTEFFKLMKNNNIQNSFFNINIL